MNELQRQYKRDLQRLWRKYSVQPMVITQSLRDFDLYKRRHVAFEEWRRKLKRGSRLPRGRFFEGKQPGSSHFVMDEFHSL